ncbi:hypothetical protein EMO55_18335 [Escherichia coli]|nr:hypothetical protein [Escherichia coli]EHY3673452.1 hypothetical protein [Escherichia coli]
MIKDLVASGHALADDMTGAPSVLVRCLAAQLEVQLVRANALAEDHQRAIESIKQADSAVKLAHEKFSALAAENIALKSAHPQQFGQKMMDALVAYEECQDDVPERGMLNAFFILRDSVCIDTPATGAFLAEVRAQGVEMLAKNHQSIVNALKGDSLFSDGEYLHAAIVSAAVRFAAELRKGGNQ